MNRRTRTHVLAILLTVWVPLGLGCFLIGPREEPEPIPVEDDGCSMNHADFWEPDPAGADIAQASGGVACNEIQHFAGGGGQGGDVFHIEPTLRVTDPDLELPSAPSITWQLMNMDGEILQEQAFEVYEEEVNRQTTGFWITSRVLIGPELRGKNIRLSASMELIDSAASADAGTSSVWVEPAAALYVSPQ